MKRLLPLALLLAMALVAPIGARAQDSTPIAGGCTVQPMSQERIEQLAAQAATPSAPVTPAPIDLSQGQPVSDEVRWQLYATITQLQACSTAQDLPRLLSLYTERFIVQEFFAEEPVQIVQSEGGTPVGGTIPPGATDQEMMVMGAVQLPDGRIAANISSNAWGGGQRLYIFVEQDGWWLIDSIGSGPGKLPGGGTPVSDDTPTDAQRVVDLILQDAAAQFGVDPSELTVSSLQPVEWPDASLGCPEDGGVYAQVVSPGYQLTVTYGDRTIEYHTGPNDAFVTCESGS